MRFSSTRHRPSSDGRVTAQDEQRQRPGDIVVRSIGAGTYMVSRIAGERIGTCHDRFDAMRRACAAARETGANVWIRVDDSSETYHEVLCP
jgi:hypothetical protein